MSDHDILLELLEAKNRLERQRKIELIVAVILIVALAVAMFFVWNRVSETMQAAQETFVKVNQVTDKIQGVFDALAEAGIEDPGQAIKDLYEDTENVRNLFDELKKAGFDNPAQVLQDLRDATAKLNELFDRISRASMHGVEQGREAFEDVRDWLAALFG